MLNAENANLDKTVEAAQRQIEAIKILEQNTGLDKLPPSLKETAEMRLEYPEASLVELAALLGIGKSGVNHRLRKLIQMADEAEDTK